MGGSYGDIADIFEGHHATRVSPGDRTVWHRMHACAFALLAALALVVIAIGWSSSAASV